MSDVPAAGALSPANDTSADGKTGRSLLAISCPRGGITTPSELGHRALSLVERVEGERSTLLLQSAREPSILPPEPVVAALCDGGVVSCQ
jgi:hypothetical protein